MVNGNNSNVEDPDDILCSCTPTATGSASKPGAASPASSTSLNNNYKVKEVSPYLVSAATSPRKKHTRTVMTPSGVQETTKTLPPLDINRTVLHHHSTRRSARKSSRIHSTVPVMLATKNSLGSSKRSHSAASNVDEAVVSGGATASTPESLNGRRSRTNRGLTASPERKSSKVLCTPERMSRRGHILNKIETVRILRARPAFYPMKDKIMDKVSISSVSNSSKSSAKSVRDTYGGGASDHHRGHHSSSAIASSSSPHDYLELPHNILGKHITLRMDRSELKRKHKRGLLPPSTHLAQQ